MATDPELFRKFFCILKPIRSKAIIETYYTTEWNRTKLANDFAKNLNLKPPITFTILE